MQEKGDIYAMYHNTPGDTSQGFWITVLLTLIGALICAVDLFLYTRCREVLAVMIPICVLIPCICISSLISGLSESNTSGTIAD